MNARSGRGSALARIPLGDATARRYGAPYWVIHRGDLHAVLREAVDASPEITLQLGARVEDFADHAQRRHGRRPHGATSSRRAHGNVLIGADGLWSGVRRSSASASRAFAGHTAWRALVPAAAVPRDCARRPQPVARPRRAPGALPGARRQRCQRGRDPADHWRETGWSADGDRDEIVARFPAGPGRTPARELIGAAEQWQKWALYDCRPSNAGARDQRRCWRRRTPDAAVPRARRGDGDRRRRGAGVVPRANARRCTSGAARL